MARSIFVFSKYPLSLVILFGTFLLMLQMTNWDTRKPLVSRGRRPVLAYTQLHLRRTAKTEAGPEARTPDGQRSLSPQPPATTPVSSLKTTVPSSPASTGSTGRTTSPVALSVSSPKTTVFPSPPASTESNGQTTTGVVDVSLPEIAIRVGTFLYLGMAATDPSKWTLSRACFENSMLLFLSFKNHTTRRADAGCRFEAIHHPHTTWTTGRNALLKEAIEVEKRQGWKFEFFIFTDNDVKLIQRGGNFTVVDAKGAAVQLDAEKMFRYLLLRDRPIRASVTYKTLIPLKPVDVMTFSCARVSYTDAFVDAYHRTGVGVLLPYDPSLDKIAWCMSAFIVNLKAAALAPESSNIYRQLGADFSVAEHANYPHGGGALDKGQEWNLAREIVRDFLVKKKINGYSTSTTGAHMKAKLHIGLFGQEGVPCVSHNSSVDYMSIFPT